MKSCGIFISERFAKVCVISVRLIFGELNDDGLLTANGLDKTDVAQVRKRAGSHCRTEYMLWKLERLFELVIVSARCYPVGFEKNLVIL